MIEHHKRVLPAWLLLPFPALFPDLALEREIPVAYHDFSPRHELRVIDFQDCKGRPSDTCLSDQDRAIPCEVPTPAVFSGME